MQTEQIVIDISAQEDLSSGQRSESFLLDDFAESHPNSSNNVINFIKRKDEIIQRTLSCVTSDWWSFQKQVDLKARNHLKNLLLDNWEISESSSKAFTFRKRSTSTEEKVVTDTELEQMFERSVNCTYKEMLREYKKWCIVSKQKKRTHPKNDTKLKVADMLLLLNVFGEIDIARTQNHVSLLLFHVSLGIVFAEDNMGRLFQDDASLSSSIQHPKPMITLSATGSCRHRQAAPLEEMDSLVCSAGALVRQESKKLYLLMVEMFDVHKRNDEFFDWDDINDLCWTPGFVQNFLKSKGEGLVYEIGGFERSFALEKYPLLKAVTLEEIAELKKDEKSRKDLEKQKNKFTRRWKTYVDHAGGWFGWRGLITYFSTWSRPVYYQLICLSVALLWLFDFQVQNYVYVGIAGAPIAVMALYFLLNHTVFLFWTSPSCFHSHRFSIPRRDTLYRDFEMKRGFCLFNFLTGHLLKIFHWHHIYSLLLIFLVSASYIATMRYVLLGPIKDVTKFTIDLTLDLVRKKININGLKTIDWVNMVLSYLAFLLLWVATLFVCAILPPILINIWVGVMGFIRGYCLRVNRVNSWTDLQRCFFDKKLILDNFQTKILANLGHKSSKDSDLVECAFATVWNAIIEDFFENHQLSKAEKLRFSYVMNTDSLSVQITKRPDLKLRPVNSEVRHHLIKFVNNLYMKMPTKNTRVIDMKRLCVFTPIFKEKVFYSWEELVKPGNTGSSFLRTLIMRSPEDWKCFKELEFPSGSRLRTTLDYVEAKILAGIDLTNHKIHTSSTSTFVKDMISSWASQRFQPVSRTVKGFMKIPKALSILLRLQNPELSDEEVRSLVRQKFSFVCGAQLYDRKVWKKATQHHTLAPKDKKRNREEHRQYVSGLDELCKTRGDTMLKIAFVKQESDSSNSANRYTAVLRSFNGDTVEDAYEINSFGHFSSVGQGKPTNQGFMLQFFDGSFCQTVDCNMDNTLCQAFFVPNLMKEFDDPKVKMVGFPEFVFTKSWSRAGFAAAFTERVFGSLVQRVWSLLNLRFHYGHPDVMRGMFVMFTSGLSKLSYISEDIFNGFDVLLNNGTSKHVDYIEVGKARDVCMVSTTKFNRKIAGGGAQIACSRYASWILSSRHLTFTDKLLFCYSVLSHYSNTLIAVAAAFILYLCRDIVLIATFVVSKHLPKEGGSKLQVAMLDISKTLALFSDSVFLLQIGMALSVPGILQSILDRGVVRGVWEYINNFLWLLTYSLFQLMNTAFYFLFGFNQSAKYIASGRSHGLQHVSIIDSYRMFRSTHFIPAGLIILLSLVSVTTSKNYGFVVFHCFLVFVWLFSPFIFNSGSTPLDVSIAIWKQLYAEDLFRVKTWIRNRCKAKDVESIMQNNRSERHMGLEYDFMVGDESESTHLELDWESGYGYQEVSFSRSRAPYDLEFSFMQLQSSMLRDRNKPEPTKLKRRRRKKEKAIPETEAEPTIMTQPLVNYGKRRKLFHVLFKLPFRILRFLIRTIPKILLLFILFGTKLLSYFIIIYKAIAPWTSPPDYMQTYHDQYLSKITEIRLMNIQQLIAKVQSNVDQRRGNEMNRRVETYAPPNNNSGSLTIRCTEIEEQFNALNTSDPESYQQVMNLVTLSSRSTKKNLFPLYKNAFNRLKGSHVVRQICIDATSASYEPTSNSLISTLGLLYLVEEYDTFTTSVNEMIYKVNDVLACSDKTRFETASTYVTDVCKYMAVEQNHVLNHLLLSTNPMRNDLQKLCFNLLTIVTDQICKIIERRMTDAKSQFRAYLHHERSNKIFNPTHVNNVEHCSSCVMTSSLNQVMSGLRESLYLVDRLKDSHEAPLTNDTSFLEQMVNSIPLKCFGFKGSPRHEVLSNAMQEHVLKHVNSHNFDELRTECQDMLGYLERRRANVASCAHNSSSIEESSSSNQGIETSESNDSDSDRDDIIVSLP